MDKMEFYKKHLKSDISAGLVVFLIALPLCLGISLASGAPLITGIIAGIVGGIVVGFFSKANVNVSGPAASVALVILTAISDLGSYEAVLLAVVLSGVIQIIWGYMGAGVTAYFFPSSMIKGFLASIGLILILKQIPHAVGYDEAFEGVLAFKQNDGFNTFSELVHMLGAIQWGSVIITIFSLILINIWDNPKLKAKNKFFQFFPGALAAVIASVFINQGYEQFFPALALDTTHLVQLPVADSIAGFFSFFKLPDFSQITNPQVYVVALSIAFIASLESLLSTEAGDRLDPYKRQTPTNHELKAQGIGNIVAGMIGAIPVTAVIVRTSANVASGGRTKVSTMTHGVIMLICVMTIPRIINLIPLASLSAILFVVGYKLTSIKLFKEMYAKGARQYIPFFSTIIGVMFTDLITGILIGGAASVLILLRDDYKTPFFKEIDSDNEKKIKITLSEQVTFINKASIMQKLEGIDDEYDVTIDATNSVNIDVDVLEYIHDFKESCKLNDIKLKLIGFERFAI
tara:strand:- start:227598 stop:229148 length:1551 start_codon:yes stop_codon:yes gene_type:complete